jgi:peptide chain release factor
MLLLQLSSSQGPAECELALAKALARINDEARRNAVSVEIVESVAGCKHGIYRSILLALDGEASPALAQRWSGTLQWRCKSPYRQGHERKNWFIGIALYQSSPEQASAIRVEDLRFETCRASGPGGQHVNKTDSAVRATHLLSGTSVKVQTYRSQHANKQLAALLIGQKLQQVANQQASGDRARRRIFHHQVERGNANLVFSGMAFVPD